MASIGEASEIALQILGGARAIPALGPARATAVERSLDQRRIQAACEHGTVILLGASAV